MSTPSRRSEPRDGLADPRRAAVDRPVGAVAADAALGRDQHLLAAPAQGPRDELLVVAETAVARMAVGAVAVGGVDERDPEVEGGVDGGDGAVRVGEAAVAAGPGERHPAEAERADGAVAEGAGDHGPRRYGASE